MFGLKKYKVDYCGQKDFFHGAKDFYRAGKRVVLYFDFIATDTDYSFFVGGIRINPGYDPKKGYIISFKMPPCDITVGYEERNSMNPPETDIKRID